MNIRTKPVTMLGGPIHGKVIEMYRPQHETVTLILNTNGKEEIHHYFPWNDSYRVHFTEGNKIKRLRVMTEIPKNKSDKLELISYIQKEGEKKMKKKAKEYYLVDLRIREEDNCCIGTLDYFIV